MSSKERTTQDFPSQETQPLEALIARLEEIAQLIQEGRVGLEKSIELYEEGQRIAQICTERLTAAQRKLEILLPMRPSADSLPPNSSDTTNPNTPQDS